MGPPGTTADPGDRGFQAVSVLGAVLHALHLFEAADVLGREIDWAIDGRQLLVIPRAGTWTNAFYERETGSLQFFSFAGDERIPVVHTSLSLDVVSHETGHAILDAIAPHLYDCVTPESLALHEAVGDLTALLASLERPKLRERLLDAGQGDIEGANAFTRVAPAFGHYRSGTDSLRSMWNRKKLSDITDPTNTHLLSEVVTGMVYEFLVWVYTQRWEERSPGRDLADAGAALAFATAVTRRVAWRGLDYLPPGEITFADYARAAVAADAVSNPDSPEYRERFVHLCSRREIAEPADLAHVEPDLDHLRTDVDIEELVTSESYAYRFVEEHRAELRIPDGLGFAIEPRLVVEKTAFREGGPTTYRELIMKIGWEQREDSGRRRWIRFGTTVVFGRDDGQIVALLTTNPAFTQEDRENERRRMVDRLVDSDFVDDADEPMGDEVTGLRFRGTGRTLHAARAGDGPPVDIDAELAELDSVVTGYEQ